MTWSLGIRAKPMRSRSSRLLIFGVKVRLSTIEGGDFYCPSCGGDRRFARRRARRWFTLFFVPAIYLLIARDHHPAPSAAPLAHPIAAD